MGKKVYAIKENTSVLNVTKDIISKNDIIEVNTYKEKGLNITLLEKKHTGNRALNRRFAVEASNGKNLIFLDADMIPCRTFVEKHNKNLIQNRKTVSLGYRKLLSKISCFLSQNTKII